MTFAEMAAHDLINYGHHARYFSQHYQRDMERRRALWRIQKVRPFTRIIWLEPID